MEYMGIQSWQSSFSKHLASIQMITDLTYLIYLTGSCQHYHFCSFVKSQLYFVTLANVKKDCLLQITIFSKQWSPLSEDVNQEEVKTELFIPILMCLCVTLQCANTTVCADPKSYLVVQITTKRQLLKINFRVHSY